MGLARSLFDEDGGKGAEDECLDAAGEPVEVEAGNGGQAHGQPGELGENAAEAGQQPQNAQHRKDNTEEEQLLLVLLLPEEDHQSAHNGDGNGDDPIGAQRAEEGIAGSGQRAIDQGADNGAGENIAEVTAGHADGGKELGHDVDGGHDEDGVKKALQVAANAGGLDLVVGDQHKDHQRPAQLRHQVCCGAPDAQKADQVGDDAGDEDGADQWNVPVKFRSHFVVDEIYKGIVNGFRCGLLPGDVRHLQVGLEPTTL